SHRSSAAARSPSTTPVEQSADHRSIHPMTWTPTAEDDRRFLALAIEQATKSGEEGGVPIGAVLVHDGQVRAAGHNQRVQKASAILHGETDTIERAGRLRARVYRESVRCTALSPCRS